MPPNCLRDEDTDAVDAADTCAWDAIDDLLEASALPQRERELAATEVACEPIAAARQPTQQLRRGQPRRVRSSRHLRSRRVRRVAPRLGVYLGVALAAVAVVAVCCLRG